MNYFDAHAFLNELRSKPVATIATLSQVRNPFGLSLSQQSQLSKLEASYRACLEVQTWPHYRQFSPATLQAESDTLERLRKKISETED